MSILLDTGIVYAYYDRSDAWHARARGIIRAEAGGLVIPGLVLPEVDHLLGHRLGAKARRIFYQGLLDGDYDVADLSQEHSARVVELDRRFADLEIGFVDAAVVVLAELTGIRRIATSDRRHFERLAAAMSFELIP
jgi:predicted nucleic acid-binding protein